MRCSACSLHARAPDRIGDPGASCAPSLARSRAGSSCSSGLAMAANATWFPASLFASEDSAWRVAWRAFIPSRLRWRSPALACWSSFSWRKAAAERAATTAGVAIGRHRLGSLSLRIGPSKGGGGTRRIQAPAHRDHRHRLVAKRPAVPRRGAARTPNIRRFLDDSRRFSDATTPLARTYGSWVSILTGRHPVTTNARYNLMPRRLVNEGDTLGRCAP